MSVRIPVGDALARTIELQPDYAEMARRRIESENPMFAKVAVEERTK